MPRRRAIKAVLHNFLETYTSRYSDYNGYWLFGQTIGLFDRLEFDLLGESQTCFTPLIDFSAHLAILKFNEQLKMAGFERSILREARLVIAELPGDFERPVNSHVRCGNLVSFTARVVTDLGKTFEKKKWIFVAPHDPCLESRRWMPS
jgi:hypothetical protein